MRPFIEDVTDFQQEHDAARCIEIPAQHRNRDRDCIEYLDFKFAVQQTLQALADMLQRPEK